MASPTARQLGLGAVAVAAVAGLALAVAGPLTPADPTTPAAPPSVSAPSSASPVAPVSATPTPSPTVTPVKVQPPKGRVAGDDVYAISAAAAQASFPGSARAPVVFLVSGESQSQAYGALPAAAVQGGAVLLTRPDGIPKVVAAELDRLGPDRIVLVGGGTVLLPAVERAAATHAADVERVDGRSTAAMSIALARYAFPTAEKAWVASGDHAEHAVVAATAAAGNRSPLLVVDGGATGLPAASADLLRDLGVTDVTVVGPTAAVSTGIAQDLEDLVGAEHVVRAEGADRHAVAAAVNALAWPALPTGVAYLANGQTLGAAFAGASLAGLSQRPLYYSLPYCVPASVRTALVRRSVSRVVLVGDEQSVRGLAGRLEPCQSISDPTSEWVLVNRRNPLSPIEFGPSDLKVPRMQHAGGHQLRADAADALAEMAAAVAAGAGRVGIDTAYRSYAVQDALYDKWLARRGRTWTDTWYARPGYSEHQTGLTVDLLPVGESNCSINDCIDETPQGRWLARNSWRYGYILRYEEGYRSTVGLGFEPWHFRFVGSAMARAYHDGGWHTLEAFLDEPGAPSY